MTSTAIVASLAPGTGAVFSVIPPENATGNFTKIVQRVPVRILLDAGDARLRMLRPGLSTTVSVDTRDDGRTRRDRGGAAGAPLASVLPFVVMCVGMFIALLDIQIVASSLAGYRRRTVRGAGRDQLGADRLSDRRDHHDPAVRLADAGVLHALAVHRLGAGFTLTSMLCGLAWDIHSMIVFRALQGMLGASMIPTVFTSSFYYLPGPAAGLFGGRGRHHRLDGADAGAGDRRLDHRYAELALAVLHQPGARADHHRRWCRCW